MMAKYQDIISNYLKRYYFAGDAEKKSVEQEKSRNVLVTALGIRKKECKARYNIAIVLLITATLLLLFFAFFQSQNINMLKEIMSIIGGGSIAGLLFYIISMRDEITKINQTLLVASAVEKSMLDSMLLIYIGK